METINGIILNERQFQWVNFHDQFGLFTYELHKIYGEENEPFLPEQLAASFNKDLFENYQYLVVTPEDELFGWDGHNYQVIPTNGENLHEFAENAGTFLLVDDLFRRKEDVLLTELPNELQESFDSFLDGRKINSVADKPIIPYDLFAEYYNENWANSSSLNEVSSKHLYSNNQL